MMTNGIVYELAPQSPDRGVENTGRGEAKRNPCKKEAPAKQSAEGSTEFLSPQSGLVICSYILCRGSATLHHQPVFSSFLLDFSTCLCSHRPFGISPPACVLIVPWDFSTCLYSQRPFGTLPTCLYSHRPFGTLAAY